MSLSSLAGSQADLDNIGAQGRGDAGEVEPINALEDLVEVEVSDGSIGHSRMCTVVDADGTTLRSALLVEVDANTVTAAGDLAGVNAVAAQSVHAGLADSMSGQLGDESNVSAVVGQRNSHIGLAAAVGVLQGIGLHKAQMIVGLQTDHNFTESNDFHGGTPLLLFLIKNGL